MIRINSRKKDSSLMSEESWKIDSEYDFLYYYYKKRGSSDTYPRVTNIPKGTSISPDIDLLEIEPYKNPPRTVGYEFKIISKNDPYGPFYKGLGEALNYFNHGIEQAFVMLGTFGMDIETIQHVEKTIEQFCKFGREHGHIPRYLGVKIYQHHNNYINDLLRVEDNSLFSVSSNRDTQHKKDCILRKEFSWGKKWLKEMERKFPSTR